MAGSDYTRPAAGAIACSLSAPVGSSGHGHGREPLFHRMPEIWGSSWSVIYHVGLSQGRHPRVAAAFTTWTADASVIVEYFGPRSRRTISWDRHVIANMGAELGATTTVFPSRR